MAKKEQQDRVTADVREIRADLDAYPGLGEVGIDEDAWNLLTDGQKLIYLAKRQFRQARESGQEENS